MKTYHFIGEGRGVPGLPHKLTDIDAQRLGVEKLLADALKAKIYEITEEKAKPVDIMPSVKEETESSGKKTAKNDPVQRDKEA